MAYVTYKRLGETSAFEGDCGNCGLRVRELIYAVSLSFYYLLTFPAIRGGSKVSHACTSRSFRNSGVSLDSGGPTVRLVRDIPDGDAT